MHLKQHSSDKSLLELPRDDELLLSNDDAVENENRQSPSTPTSFKGSRSEVSDISHETIPSSVDNTGEDMESQVPTITATRTITTPSGENTEFQFTFKTKSEQRGRMSIELDPLSELSHSNHSNTTIKQQFSEPIISQTLAQGQHHSTQKNHIVSQNTAAVSNKPLTSSATVSNLQMPKTLRRHTSPAKSTLVPSNNINVDNNNNNNNNKDSNDNKAAKRKSHNDSLIQLSKSSFVAERPLARSTYPVPAVSNNIKSHSHHDLPRSSSTTNEIRKMRDSITGKRPHRRRHTVDDERILVGNKISEGHENFVMAYNMLTGIRVAVSRLSGVMRKLQDEDFKATKKLVFNVEGNELTPSSKYDFKFKDYCPEVFRELRQIFGVDPADYLISITGKYILSELGSPGKSGSFFYYSRDYRFIIKTIHHSEKKQLLRMLKDYYNHVKENPNILISQFYGLHRVKMPMFSGGTRVVHFVVMNNLFPPHRDIHLKFDLKGSTWGRVTRISPEETKLGELSKYTLKDINWLEMHEQLKFGPNKRNAFLQQLEKDVALLQKVNVMDYSLLLGIHDVKRGNSDDIGQKLSVFEPKSSDKTAIINTNPRDIDRSQDLPFSVFPGRSKYIFYGHDGGIRATNEENVPLQEIYYLGVIDCLTPYGFKKRLETCWRSLSHLRSTISAVPAKEYGDRFYKFIKDGTTSGKLKKS